MYREKAKSAGQSMSAYQVSARNAPVAGAAAVNDNCGDDPRRVTGAQ